MQQENSRSRTDIADSSPPASLGPAPQRGLALEPEAPLGRDVQSVPGHASAEPASSVVETEETSGVSTERNVLRAERILSLITNEVALGRKFGAESLAVLIKPDAETDLLLQVTVRNGQMEATVRCERGDFQGLSRHWGQLTEAMAHQNVRLLPLKEPLGAHPLAAGHSTSTPFTGGNTFRRSHRQPAEREEGLSFVGSATEPVNRQKAKTRFLAHRGWESWA